MQYVLTSLAKIENNDLKREPVRGNSFNISVFICCTDLNFLHNGRFLCNFITFLGFSHPFRCVKDGCRRKALKASSHGRSGTSLWVKCCHKCANQITEDEELYYYENKGDVAPKGRILLTDIQRVDSVSGGFFSRGYYFNAVTKDRTYELCAEDDNDRKEWISILQRASAHFKKMAKEAPVNTNETYDASDMNMNDDEEHVELTEEDMNDPDLLGELTELHGKEGLIEHLKELSAKIDSDKQKCIQFRDAGNIEEAKKLLLKVKNLQKQKESLELKIQNYDKQEEELEEEVTEEPQEEEEPVEEEQVEEEDMPSHDDTKSSATEVSR